MPSQIPFIIANEGCERFSFYGMRNILTVFLSTILLVHLPAADRGDAAKDVFHTFVIGVYLFPLLGGWLADRFFGKYDTIFWLSLVYCAGHACLAIFEDNRTGFYTGLFLIALGSGGIKPLVASFMGDQFDRRTKHLAKVVFDAFYWIINFGSFFASLLMPIFLRDLGPSIAFGIPGALMLIATVAFWSGRRRYVMVPPAPPSPDSFLRVVRTALSRAAPGERRPGLVLAGLGVVLAIGSLVLTPQLGFVIAFCLGLVLLLGLAGAGTWIQLGRARGAHPDEAIAGVRVVLRVLVAFALVTPFWSLFDQKASTWVLQAADMTKPWWFEPSQMQALNPLLVILLIPFNNLVLYPALRRHGYEPTALRRMTLGIAFAGVSWITIAVVQMIMDTGAPPTIGWHLQSYLVAGTGDGPSVSVLLPSFLPSFDGIGTELSIAWQILPYALLTFGEVLVSATGLEFAYSQAPPAMKGVIMSFWNLAVTVGNLWVLVANAGVRNPAVLDRIQDTGLGVTAFLMFAFAAFAILASIAFGLYARGYKVVDNYRSGDA